MTLDELLQKHVPIPKGTCKIKAARLEALRWRYKERIALQKELHTIPQGLLDDVKKYFGELK